MNPLLGEAPEPKLVNEIIDKVMEYDLIMGVHDLIIHNYGPNKWMASIHAEVPANESIMKIHEVIDDAEKYVSEKLDILLVIHMDPVNTDDEEVEYARREIVLLLMKFPMIKSMHDFRVVGKGDYKNLIFDIVVDYTFVDNAENTKKIKDDINSYLKEKHPEYTAVITIDKDFMS
ncbi:hypothetical protein GCM10008906_04540 [Clostridium oceanicum]|uniref:Cation efflux protein cytoplasmic domain-containing protein n=1 Tax=Clostridium oceanicum TaxID=1543 RepID=A0ABP3UGH5_9CLOT